MLREELLKMASDLCPKFKTLIESSKKDVQKKFNEHTKSMEKLTNQLQGLQAFITSQFKACKEYTEGTEEFKTSMMSKIDQVLAALAKLLEKILRTRNAPIPHQLFSWQMEGDELASHTCSLDDGADTNMEEIEVEES